MRNSPGTSILNDRIKMNCNEVRNWVIATRRMWVALLLRYLIASTVVSPSVAVLALLVSAIFSQSQLAFYIVFLSLGITANLAAMLWATRQALLKAYPEGKFHLQAA